jgi:glycosyltransferase involved in cell wall biosynthesis
MPSLSIIVPVYNVEQYIHGAIDSILAQTYTDFELILVDDGSTDSSGEICNEFAKKDPRIIVIHQKNGGVSSARNAGIDCSQGEYIGFVDPDDIIDPSMYESLVGALIRHEAEMVICIYRIFNEKDHNFITPGILKPANRVIDQEVIGNEMMPKILVNNTLSLDPCVNKVYKKSIIDQHQLRFDEQRDYGEDARFNFILLTLIDRLVYVDQPLYHYIKRQRNSLSQVFRENAYTYLQDEKSFYLRLSKIYHLSQYEEVIRMLFTTKVLLFTQEIVSQKYIPVHRKYKMITAIIYDPAFQKDISNYKTKNVYYRLLKYLCMRQKGRYLMKVIQWKHKIRSPV